MGSITPERKKSLERYVTNPNGRIFCITGLPPEVGGAALARYSRSAKGFQDTLLDEFLDTEGNPSTQKGSEMIDRVVNQFGDESVAEQEGVRLCAEGISQLAVKTIEDARLGSYIEKSTRYVFYDKQVDGFWLYHRPKSIILSPLAALYITTNDFFFQTYAALMESTKELFRRRLPKETFTIDVPRGKEKVTVKESELLSDEERAAFKQSYNATIRSATCDIIRCVLPASTLTNVGIVGNARYFSNLVTRLWSSELPEAHEIADEMKRELDKTIPTFIKRAQRNEYQVNFCRDMQNLAQNLFRGIPIQPENEVVYFEDNPDDYIVNQAADMLFPFVQHPTSQIREVVAGLPLEEQLSILTAYIGDRESKRDHPGRALEFGYPIRFDLIGGFAEYRDLHRHRMCTQQRQRLTTSLGFSIPEEIDEIGMLPQVKECFEKSEFLHAELLKQEFEEEAQYAILFNHFIRWTMAMNPRELGYLTELRTQIAGHPRYRRMAQIMTKLYLERHPELASLFAHVDYSDPGDKIARAAAEAKTAYKSLISHVQDSE